MEGTPLMKIWIITTEYPPFFGGGIATYCLQTAHMLASRGHEVTVIASDERESAPQLDVAVRDGVREVRFRPEGPAHSCMGYVAARSHDISEVVRRLIEREDSPDVIECQDYQGIGYFLLQQRATLCPGMPDIPIAVTLHSPKFIIDEHEQLPRFRLPGYWIGEMERFCVVAADAVISPSSYALEELGRHMDCSNLQSFVVPHPFDMDAQLLNDDYVANDIVFLGRKQYSKGILHVIRYFEDLWQGGWKIPLTLVGGDTLYHPKEILLSEYLKTRYSRQMKDGLLIDEGLLEPCALRSRLQKAHVVVIGSLFESFSYSLLESMSLGCMVLASRSGGPAEILTDGESGFLFGHGEKTEFKIKLEKILSMSSAQRKAIRNTALATVKTKYSFDAVYPAKIAVLEEVVEKRRHSRKFPFIRPQPSNVLASISGYREEPGLLSVVIPYYNMGPYLRETIESVFASELSSPMEVVVVNDGSDDVESIAELYRLEKRFPIKLLHKLNGGLCSARNAGLRACHGEFAAILDADDLVEPEYYERAVRILKRYDNVGMVGSWLGFFEGSEGVWPTWNAEPPYLLVHNTLNSSGIVMRRRAALAVGGNDIRMEHGQEDYEFVINLMKNGRGGVAIPKVLFRYRIRKNSIFRQYTWSAFQYCYFLIAEKHRDLYAKYSTEVCSILNENGPGYLFDNPTFETEVIQTDAKRRCSELEIRCNELAAECEVLSQGQQELEMECLRLRSSLSHRITGSMSALNRHVKKLNS
jgi:glycosyltransferase involved in cell wall biosynthesis